MQRYHVYAIGNALVDMEYEVDHTDLEALGIDKGVMTLVDEPTQVALMRHLHEHHHVKGSGGSAANSVIALSQMGGKGLYSCKVANDPLGHFYLDDLLASGVDTNRHAEKEPGHTGRCVVLVTPDSDRTMLTFLGISGNLSEVELVPDAIRQADYFYMEGYLVTSPSARDAVVKGARLAREAGVKTAISLSDPNIVKHFRSGLEDMIDGGVDLLFANEAEAKDMAGTQDLQEALTYLGSIARQYVITRGAQGALIHDGTRLLEIDPVPVEPVDTVGAGDMFAGAFLYGLTQGWEHARAGALAAAAAATLVTHLGPRLPAENTRAVLRRFA